MQTSKDIYGTVLGIIAGAAATQLIPNTILSHTAGVDQRQQATRPDQQGTVDETAVVESEPVAREQSEDSKPTAKDIQIGSLEETSTKQNNTKNSADSSNWTKLPVDQPTSADSEHVTVALNQAPSLAGLPIGVSVKAIESVGVIAGHVTDVAKAAMAIPPVAAEKKETTETPTTSLKGQGGKNRKAKPPVSQKNSKPSPTQKEK